MDRKKDPLPRIRFYCGRTYGCEGYTVGVFWSRVPIPEREEGLLLYQRQWVIEFNPRALRNAWWSLKAVVTVRT